jgi:hypothetical protein
MDSQCLYLSLGYAAQRIAQFVSQVDGEELRAVAWLLPDGVKRAGRNDRRRVGLVYRRQAAGRLTDLIGGH